MGITSSKSNSHGISYWQKHKDKYYLVIRPSNDEDEEEKNPTSIFKGGVQSVEKINSFLREKKEIETSRVRKCFNIFLTSIFDDIMRELDSNKRTEFSYDIRIICTYSESSDLHGILSILVKEKIESQNWYVKMNDITYSSSGYLNNLPFADFDLRTHDNEKCSYHGIGFRMTTKQYIGYERSSMSPFYITPVKVYLDEYCSICVDDETKSTEVLLPCGHCCTCKDCYNALQSPKECPKCREPIVESRPATKEELIPRIEDQQNKIGAEVNLAA